MTRSLLPDSLREPSIDSIDLDAVFAERDEYKAMVDAALDAFYGVLVIRHGGENRLLRRRHSKKYFWDHAQDREYDNAIEAWRALREKGDEQV